MAALTAPSPLSPATRQGAWASHAAIATLAALPVVVWPGLATPFSSPKLWVLALGTVLVVLTTRRRRAQPLPLALAWLGSAWVATFIVAAASADLYDVEATLLGILCVAFALAVVRSGVAPSRVVTAQTSGATLVAVIALVQWMGIDVFAAVGWRAPIAGASVRMRVFATMGNPNFVGALMAMSLGLAGAVVLGARTAAGRCAAMAAAVVQAGALLATGSRGAVLGLAAGALAWAAVRWSGRAVAVLLVVLAFGGAAIEVSPARPLDTTIAGRVYLWRVVTPFATQDWLTGLGPGVFELRFPQWQRDAAARGDRDRRFLGLTDHAHNDYLEALVERGAPGLLTLLAAIVMTWRSARSRPRPVSPTIAAALSTVVAGAACALVDFPLARPVELTWWWTAIALTLPLSPRVVAKEPPDDEGLTPIRAQGRAARPIERDHA